MTDGVSLIVPVYNEERRLAAFVEEVASWVGGALSATHHLAEVVLIDDGSTDSTADLLGPLRRHDRWCVVPSLGANVGKGDAVKRGVAAASGSVVLFSDVDLAVPLGEATKLLDELDRGVALAFGSRDLAGSDVTAPWQRAVAGKIFNLLVRGATGLGTRDTQCGFKAMRRELAASLLSEQLVPGLAFDVELLLRARSGGHTTSEVPVRYVHGLDSQVQPLRHGARMATDVVRAAWLLRRAPGVTALADPDRGQG